MTSSMSTNGLTQNEKTKQFKPNQNIKNTISVNKLASQIAHDIYITSTKLEELTKLSKSKSPFGDPGDKIQELTYLIKGDLKTIQNKLEQLESIVKSQKTDQKTSQVKTHSETLVNTLQTNLVNTTKVFTDALEIRTKNLKVQEERREKLTGTRRTTPSPVFQPDIDMYDNSDDGNMDEMSISVPLMETTDDLIIQRLNSVYEIEENIKQVREMFQKLANIVSIQNESIMRIEDNIEEVSLHVEHTQKNLLQYLQKVVSDRSTVIKVFLILAFFIFLFFMFFL